MALDLLDAMLFMPLPLSSMDTMAWKVTACHEKTSYRVALHRIEAFCEPKTHRMNPPGQGLGLRSATKTRANVREF